MRWIVGDIHGCARELDDLLARVRFDEARDELWCVGDLVNRGPDSLAALRLWRDVAGHALLGNHDIHAVLLHAKVRAPRPGDTLETLLGHPEASTWIARLRALPVLVHLGGPQEDQGVWIVHAGLDPRWSDLHEAARRLNETTQRDDKWLSSEEVTFATHVRCCAADGERVKHAGRPQDCPAPFKPWDSFYRGHELVVHGHWAARGYHRSERILGLDSGCVYGGKLTAWSQEEDRIEQVPSRASGFGPKHLDLGS